MNGASEQELAAKAQSIERKDGPLAALAWMEAQLEGSAPSPDLSNFTGNLAMHARDFDKASVHFGKAAEAAPTALEYPINQAIALSSVGKHRAALQVLESHEEAGRSDPRYGSVRANAARNSGDLAAAAKWYDQVLKLDPQHKKALNGRARVAIERAESDALQRFDHALTIDSGNADLWLGKAQALDVNGDTQGARAIAQQLVDQAPSWTEGLRFMAQLRLGAGEVDFTSHYQSAADKAPQDPNILNEWITQLAGLDYAAKAAEVAASARQRFPSQPFFALLEAIHAGSAGDDDRAEAIFAKLDFTGQDRLLHEARHRIRRGEFDRAETLLTATINNDPGHIAAWALRGIVWRCTDDSRADWLHGQEGMFGPTPLANADEVLPPAIEVLSALHDTSCFPLGQSLRGGTQTRGRLFDRLEPELATLKSAIEKAVSTFVERLPPADPAHPILRNRDAAWQIAGSWSVRLSGGSDHHTSHIHPQGMLSSALYMQLPDSMTASDENAGWLELGRPPPDLRLELPPIGTIEPKPGELALFPSTLYHGTRPFPDGKRMTVAFDIVSPD